MFVAFRQRWHPVGGLLVLVCLAAGCGGQKQPTGNTEPVAKTNLTRLLRLYQVYVDKNSKGPPDEKTLVEFGTKLTATERDEYLIGDDLVGIFKSPRDNQPYVVQYNRKLDPAADMFAIAWEATGADGMKYVALSNGYVEEYDDETLASYKK